MGSNRDAGGPVAGRCGGLCQLFCRVWTGVGGGAGWPREGTESGWETSLSQLEAWAGVPIPRPRVGKARLVSARQGLCCGDLTRSV